MSRTKNAARKGRYSTNVDRHSSSGQNLDPAILGASNPKQVDRRSGGQNSDIVQDETTSKLQGRVTRQIGGRVSRRNSTAGHSAPRSSTLVASHRSKDASDDFGDRVVGSSTGRGSSSRNRQLLAALQGTRKRKALDGPSDEPASQRARLGQTKEFIDEAYIRRTMEYPTKEQYPHAPASLFGEQLISTIHNMNKGLSLEQEIVPLHDNPHTSKGPAFISTIQCGLPSQELLNVEGHGLSKRDASRAAHAHLLARLHKGGILRDLFPAPEKQLDKEVLREEAGAKFDVYNYAARFGLIPTFTERPVNRHGGSNRRSGRFAKGGKPLVEVTIEVKEQGIKTSGRGSTLDTAEIAASIRFKEEAEKYHAEHGDGSIVIKDSTVLNIGNAKLFFEFYKLEYKDSLIDMVVENIRSHVPTAGSLFQGQVMINSEPVGVPVTSKNKKSTEELAYLAAAVTLTQNDADLLQNFQAALAVGNGTAILTPLKPIDMELHEDAIFTMQHTLKEVRKLGLPSRRGVVEPEPNQDTSRDRPRQRLTDEARAQKHAMLQEQQRAFMTDPKLQAMRELRDSLPMSQFREKVLDLVNNNTYSIIIGATGSGKTTQVPQILLDDAISRGRGGNCDVICTQPRRIAATSVARRVADERNEALKQSVGYHVRFDARPAPLGGSINFCTTGVLLQQLQHQPDDVFDTVSHIVVDEVHERDILIDFLMILLKKTMHTRILAGKSVPKVILMSATIDEELFAKYFQITTKDGQKLPCPSLSVPGRTFPVKERYFENIVKEIEQEHGPEVIKALTSGVSKSAYGSIPSDDDTRVFMNGERDFKALPSSGHASQDEDVEATIDWKRERTLAGGDGRVANEKEDALVPVPLVATTIAHIATTSTDGAILVFLPGFDEIKKVRHFLEDHSPLGVDFKDAAKFKLSVLHSTVPAAEQAEVFVPVPEGCRKVILSTNIAETSVTIPDIQYVVDTGKLREKRYDQIRRITQLQCTWISKSNAKQRAGRAGRVQNGNYYALYSKARYESLRGVGLPEMLRSDLQEICLDIKAQAFRTPIREFLAQSIEPPSAAAVDASVLNLVALEALTEEENLTGLGRVLATLPVHPTLGKMIILGIIFRCLDPMIILGAAMNERSPFVSPPDKRAAAGEMQRRFLEGSGSDHVALINAIRQTRFVGDTRGPQAMVSFGMDHFVHLGAFRTINSTSKQIEEILVDIGLIPYTADRDRFDGELGHPTLNKNANNVTLIRALALAGTHPNLAVCRGVSFRTPGEKAAMIHPASLNFIKHSKYSATYPPGALFCYSTMNKSNDGHQMMMRETSAVTPLMATLFGGRVQNEGNLVKMDSWLPFYVKSSTFRSNWGLAATVLEFRDALDKVLAAAYASLKPKPQTRHTASGPDPSASLKKNTYLADDVIREAFSSGLVEVLDKDVVTVAAPVERERPHTISTSSKSRVESRKPSGYRSVLRKK